MNNVYKSLNAKRKTNDIIMLFHVVPVGFLASVESVLSYPVLCLAALVAVGNIVSMSWLEESYRRQMKIAALSGLEPRPRP